MIRLCLTCKKNIDSLGKKPKGAKYCSVSCSSSAQKGLKKPHTEEHHNKRMESIKNYMEKNKEQFSIKSKENFIKNKEKIMNGLEKARLKTKVLRKLNPEKFNKIAIKNLPKDVRGEKNGNWKNGITKLNYNWRTQNGNELRKWRASILKRDGNMCRLCGSTNRLEAHHIIPLSQTRLLACSMMNGITLCRTCHKSVDTCWGKGVRFTERIEDTILSTSLNVLTFTIPHNMHVYPTLGNYEWISDNLLVIFVSEVKNPDYTFMINLHEYVEAFLTKRKGISDSIITKFDISFENNELENCDDIQEPGDHPDSPYRKQHRFAENIERLIAQELGIDFNEYNKFLYEFWEKNTKTNEKLRKEINPEIGK